tara:strand:- start:8038 stop:8985 length:948 start_codon:yes stop_codon:yes gene_type:complete
MNLTEILYQLTARVTSKFDLGVPYNILVDEIAGKHEVEEKIARSALSLLSELNNIDIIICNSQPTRVKIKPRGLIKTTDNRLVLCGARGPSLVEHLEKKNLITKEVLNFSEFNFEILTLKLDIKVQDDDVISLTGPSTDLPTCYYIIDEVENLDEWVNSLTWGIMTGNPYSNQHGKTKQFNINGQAMWTVSDQRLAIELIEQGKGWQKNWRLIKNENNQFKGLTLPTLNDSRTAKLFVNKSNNMVPFHWDGENLHMPKYLKLPFGVMRALQTASMKPSEEGWISISNQTPIRSLVYSGIDDKLIRLIGDKIVGWD